MFIMEFHICYWPGKNFKCSIRVDKFLNALAIYAPMIYSTPCIMLLMQTVSITRVSGRGLGPGNRDFFEPCKMTSGLCREGFL
jgi:hypothetical protein